MNSAEPAPIDRPSEQTPDKRVPKKPGPEKLGTLRVMGVRLDDIAIPDLLKLITEAIDRKDRLLVMNVNAHLLNLAWTRPWLRDFFARADIVFCDGAGAQLATRLLTGRLPSRSTPPEWIAPLGDAIGAKGGSVFWLGGAPGVVERAASAFEKRHGARTAGFHHGFFDHKPGSSDNAAIVAAINTAKPDLLVVNMGMPLQEQWLYHHWDKLDARVAITAGALVDHVAGKVRRPPRWVANLGIEWAVRLAIEPRRLWRRYLIGLPVFGFRLMSEKLAPRAWD